MVKSDQHDADKKLKKQVIFNIGAVVVICGLSVTLGYSIYRGKINKEQIRVLSTKLKTCNEENARLFRMVNQKNGEIAEKTRIIKSQYSELLRSRSSLGGRKMRELRALAN